MRQKIPLYSIFWLSHLAGKWRGISGPSRLAGKFHGISRSSRLVRKFRGISRSSCLAGKFRFISEPSLYPQSTLLFTNFWTIHNWIHNLLLCGNTVKHYDGHLQSADGKNAELTGSWNIWYQFLFYFWCLPLCGYSV